MQNYGASIQLTDQMTPILNNIMTELDKTVSMVYNVQSSVDGFDASGFDALRETVAQANSELDLYKETINKPLSVPDIPEVSWQSGNFDVFTDTGAERYTAEIQSAVNMIDQLNMKQQQITQTAAQTDVFSKNAVLDMVGVGNKLNYIRERISLIESNPANPLDPNASTEIERLRQQLAQALDYQQQMNNAVENLDISRANQLYNQLNNVVNQTEQEIRDNVNAQGQMNKSIQQSVGTADMLKSTFSKIASTFGLYKIGSELMETASQAVDFASDLTEVQNVVDVTFSKSASVVVGWASDTLNSFGINELSAKKYAGTMGAMLKSSGVAQDSVAEMSMSIAELSGDMASFYDLSGDEAFNKIRSGISGETEPLKQLGINMSVANLEAYALSQGIKTSYSEMSQGEQVVLRYNYLLNQTADAQGDFSRTSDSYANQTKLLSENWQSFTGMLAADALPVLSTVTQVLNSAVSFLSENSETVKTVLVGIAAAVTAGAIVWGVYSAATWLSVAANRALVASLLTNPIIWIAIIIGVVVAAIYRWVQSLGGLKNAWEIVNLAFQTGMLMLEYSFCNSIDGILAKTEAFKLGWKTAGVNIADYVGDMTADVLTILQNLINGSIDIINSFIGVINKIPGVSIDAVSHVTFATTAASENEARKQNRAQELAEYENEIKAIQAQRTANIERIKTELDNSAITLKTAYQNARESAAAEDKANETSSIAEGVSEIARNSQDISDTVGEISDNELEWLRKIAERESVNRFTTAEIKLDFSSTATLNSDMDIDGYINTFTTELQEVLVSTAEALEK